MNNIKKNTTISINATQPILFATTAQGAMRMRAEPASARDGIVIQHAQTPKAHPERVVITREGKAVVRVEPAMIGVTPVFGFANRFHPLFIHGAAPGAQYFDAAQPCRSG